MENSGSNRQNLWDQLYPGAHNPDRDQAIGRTYDQFAPEYEAALEAVGYRNLRAVKEIMQSEGAISGSILDLGSGPGNLAKVLGPNFTYYGTEVSPAMAQAARDNGYEGVYEHNIELVLQSIPLDKSFDYVVAASSLQFIDPKHLPMVLTHMRRLARRGIIFTLDQIPPELQSAMEKATGIKTYDHTQTEIGPILAEHKVDASGQTIPSRQIRRDYTVGWKSPNIGVDVPVTALAEFYADSGYSPYTAPKNLYQTEAVASSAQLVNWEKVLTGADENWPTHLDTDEWGLTFMGYLQLKEHGFDPDSLAIDTRKHPEVVDTEIRWILEPINQLDFIKVINGNPGFPAERTQREIELIKQLYADTAITPEDLEQYQRTHPPYPGGYVVMAMDFADPRSEAFLDKLELKMQEVVKLYPETKLQVIGHISPLFHVSERVKNYVLDFRIDPDLTDSTVEIHRKASKAANDKIVKARTKTFIDGAHSDYYQTHQIEDRAAIQGLLALVVEAATSR